MSPYITFIREFINPFRALASFVRSLIPIYWEILFGVLVVAYGVVFILVNGMNDLNSRYAAYLHRGLWEDVMVRQSAGLDFDEPWNGPGLHLKNKLDEGTYELSYIKRVITRIDLKTVVYEGKDISRLHGQFDVWLKSYAPEGDIPDFVSSLSPNTIALSKKLATKFGIHHGHNLEKIQISFSNNTPPTDHTFQLAGIVDLGGRYNILFLNPHDMAVLGHSSRSNVIGINSNRFNPEEIKKLVGNADLGRVTVETASARDQFVESMDQGELQQTMQIVINVAPVALLGLFTIVLMINFHYKCRHYLEDHASEFWLLRFYGMAPAKRLCAFLISNVSVAIMGLCFAVFAAALAVGMMRHLGISEVMNRVDFSVCQMVLHWRIVVGFLAIIAGLSLYGSVLYRRHPGC